MNPLRNLAEDEQNRGEKSRQYATAVRPACTSLRKSQKQGNGAIKLIHYTLFALMQRTE